MSATFQTKSANLKVNVAIDESGNICDKVSGTPSGKKSISIPNVNPSITVDQANTVWQSFIGTLCNSTYDTTSGALTVTKDIVDSE